MVNFMVIGGKLCFQTREKYLQIPVIASVNLSIKELYAPIIEIPILITKNSITTQVIKIPNLMPPIFFLLVTCTWILNPQPHSTLKT